MASRIRPLVAGNWKMNGAGRRAGRSAQRARSAGRGGLRRGVDAMICPPATLIAALAREAAGSRLLVGAQDCHAAASGAHTGDISAEMLKDAGATAVIVGHSERRADHGERDRDVQAKALAAHRAGIYGHFLHRRNSGRAAGGTDAGGGRTPTRRPRCRKGDRAATPSSPTSRCGRSARDSRLRVEDVAEVHGFLRRTLAERLGAEGNGHAHPLRRIGEARQRARSLGA